MNTDKRRAGKQAGFCSYPCSSVFICGAFFWLASGTKMRRAAGQAGARDGAAATPARLAGATVDAELVLILALQPRAADVIADARAALLDGVRQHCGDGLAQAAGLGGTQVLAAAGRVHPGHEQR